MTLNPRPVSGATLGHDPIHLAPHVMGLATKWRARQHNSHAVVFYSQQTKTEPLGRLLLRLPVAPAGLVTLVNDDGIPRDRKQLGPTLIDYANDLVAVIVVLEPIILIQLGLGPGVVRPHDAPHTNSLCGAGNCLA